MTNKTDVLKKYLYNVILENCIIPNYKLPSENALCTKFGISRITAKNALLSLEIDGLVHRHQGKGTFISSEAKTKLLGYEELKPLKFIGVLLPDLKSKFMLNIINGIEERLTNTNYKMILYCTHYSQKKEEQAIQELVKFKVDGFLIYPVDRQNYNQEILRLLIDKYPFTLIDRTLPGIKANTVNADHIADINTATTHLLDLGHTHIGIISTSPEGTSTISERIKGYDMALSAHKIPIHGYYKMTNMINYDTDWEEKLTSYFLDNPTLSAVIAFNSDLCYKTLRVLSKLGIRIPDQMSIISYADDYSDITDLMKITLTSILQNTHTIGKTAAGLLLDRIINPGSPEQFIKIPSDFLVQSSTKSFLPH